MKKNLLCLAVLFAGALSFGQSILTAGDFFKSVSDYYATIKDYEADVEINANNNKMTGKISCKMPEMLRIDFTDPQDQVILFNGDDLTIYLPGANAILEQNVNGSGANAASAQGLSLLRRYYTIAYETGQNAVPLDEGSGEMVVNLLLYRRTSTEAFSRIKLSVDPETKLLRRVSATTPQNEVFEFDFYNYNLNAGISDQRFIYEPPSSANNYNNFLFSE